MLQKRDPTLISKSFSLIPVGITVSYAFWKSTKQEYNFVLPATQYSSMMVFRTNM
jgi:hypothetical protein